MFLWVVALIITGPCTLGGCYVFLDSVWSLNLGGAVLGAVLFIIGFVLAAAPVNKILEDEKAKQLEKDANAAIIEINERQRKED